MSRCSKVCEPCGVLFSSSDQHANHIASPGILAHRSCYSCTQEFHDVKSYMQHARKQHGVEATTQKRKKRSGNQISRSGSGPSSGKDLQSISGPRSTQCSSCSMSFGDDKECRQHEYFVHIAPTRKLWCVDCNKLFGSMGAYEAHMKLVAHAESSTRRDFWSTPNTPEGDLLLYNSGTRRKRDLMQDSQPQVALSTQTQVLKHPEADSTKSPDERDRKRRESAKPRRQPTEPSLLDMPHGEDWASKIAALVKEMSI